MSPAVVFVPCAVRREVRAKHCLCSSGGGEKSGGEKKNQKGGWNRKGASAEREKESESTRKREREREKCVSSRALLHGVARTARRAADVSCVLRQGDGESCAS